jgi:uncharacterized membrane protein
MAIIGPIVKNELLLFTLTVALAAGWLLFGSGLRAAPAAAEAEGPQARLERAARARELAIRRNLGIVGILVIGFLSVAFVQRARVPGKAPAQALALSGDQIELDTAPLADGHMHFYQVTLPEAAVRFFAVRVNDQIQTCFDACEICGDIGYFEEGANAVCRNCTSPIVLGSLGKTGGCNPIPLAHTTRGGRLVVTAEALRSVLPHLHGR